MTEGKGYSFAIADRTSDLAVGQIGLWTRDLHLGRAEIGYWIVAGHRRRGHLTDALATLTGWASGFDEVSRLQLFVEPWNEGSWRAAERCGFRREALLRSWERVGDEPKDMYVYVLLPHG